jgi:hypothetical protein
MKLQQKSPDEFAKVWGRTYKRERLAVRVLRNLLWRSGKRPFSLPPFTSPLQFGQAEVGVKNRPFSANFIRN